MSDNILDCIKQNNIDKIKELLYSGVDVNIKDNYGETPLYYASTYGQLQIVKLIIEYGADVNAKDNDGDTPLYWASIHGQAKGVLP